jgi:hypothetical protein
MTPTNKTTNAEHCDIQFLMCEMRHVTPTRTNFTMRDVYTSSEKIVQVLKAAANKPMEDQASLAETESVGSIDDCPTIDADDAQNDLIHACDACEFCDDRCSNKNCDSCQAKGPVSCIPCVGTGRSPGPFYTLCQVRRHNHEGSAWLVAGESIYDATTQLDRHPAGAECILRKAGGAQDCTDDLNFHSKRGQQMFKKCFVGKLRKCACNGSSGRSEIEKKQWWMIW